MVQRQTETDTRSEKRLVNTRTRFRRFPSFKANAAHENKGLGFKGLGFGASPLIPHPARPRSAWLYHFEAQAREHL